MLFQWKCNQIERKCYGYVLAGYSQINCGFSSLEIEGRSGFGFG